MLHRSQDRVNVFICQLEPLSLPPTAWQLQGQILSLFLSFLIFCLYVSLTIADHFYEPLTVVSSINLLQQSAQLVLTWLHSTDIAFCCPGISITRWFIHQDFYTQVGLGLQQYFRGLSQYLEDAAVDCIEEDDSSQADWRNEGMVQY